MSNASKLETSYSLRALLKILPPGTMVGDVLDIVGERISFTADAVKEIQLELKQVALQRLFDEDPNATIELSGLLSALPQHAEVSDILEACGDKTKFSIKESLQLLNRIREITGKRLMNEIQMENRRQDKLYHLFVADTQNKFA